MQIARDSGKIACTYAVDSACPWCKTSRLRYELEFQVMSFEGGHTIESSETLKEVCTHCLTLCNAPPRMDFLCAKCGQLTLYSGEPMDSEFELFVKVFSGDSRFKGFYDELIEGGLQEGKRYCLHCLDRLWREYTANPNSLQVELKTPKPHFALKK
jgi:hypothetical protein